MHEVHLGIRTINRRSGDIKGSCRDRRKSESQLGLAEKNKHGGLGSEYQVDAHPNPSANDESRAQRWRGVDAEAEGGVQGIDRLHSDEQVK